MPDTAHPVSRFPMGSSRGNITSPVLMSSKLVSTLERWFTGVRLLGPYLTCLARLLPRRSRQGLLSYAAEGGLRPAPAGRPRRVIILHLLCSFSRFRPTACKLPSALLQHTDVAGPHLIRVIDGKVPEQVGINPMFWMGPAGVRGPAAGNGEPWNDCRRSVSSGTAHRSAASAPGLRDRSAAGHSKTRSGSIPITGTAAKCSAREDQVRSSVFVALNSRAELSC